MLIYPDHVPIKPVLCRMYKGSGNLAAACNIVSRMFCCDLCVLLLKHNLRGVGRMIKKKNDIKIHLTSQHQCSEAN